MNRTTLNRLMTGKTFDSAADALSAHGLDWRPELEQLTTASGHIAPGMSVVRSDNKTPLSIVGYRYTPTDNHEATKWLDDYRPAGVKITGCQSFKNGARNVMYATIGEPRQVIKGDYVALQLVAQWNHDSSKLNQGFLRAWRLACENGLCVADDRTIFEYRHTVNGRVAPEEIERNVAYALDSFDKTIAVFSHLARRPMTEKQMRDYATTVMDFKPDATTNTLSTRANNILDDIISRWEHNRHTAAIAADMAAAGLEQQRNDERGILDMMLGNMDAGRGQDIGGGGTFWHGYNSITEYLTHQRGRTEDSRTESLLFGESARINARALETAVAMAG